MFVVVVVTADRSICPQLSTEAIALLKLAFALQRKLRGNTMPRYSLGQMTRIAKSIAKLALRSTVTEADAVVSILLYEESLQGMYTNNELPNKKPPSKNH